MEFEILRPVRPTGISFVRYVLGHLRRNVEGFEKYVKEWRKLVTKLGYKIEDKVGNKWITCIIEYEHEEGRPVRLTAKEITVYEGKRVEGSVEV